MAMSEYDKAHVGEIIGGMGDWYHAELLRALDGLMLHADEENMSILQDAFPEECAAIRGYWNGEVYL